MQIHQQALRPVEVDVCCDKCGMDNYRPTGQCYTTMPPTYTHCCGNCGDRREFKRELPFIEYCKEGELLNLEVIEKTL